MSNRSDITELLNAAHSGDASAQDAAYRAVYDELKSCARRQSAVTPGSSLTPTALVSELYLKLRGSRIEPVHSRRHFVALAARAMRQIMVDHARRRSRAKRGGGALHFELDTRDVGVETAEQALALDAALTRLSARDRELAQIVEWHFFGGLSFGDIAAEVGRHERTVRRDWEIARAFLRKAISEAPAP